MTDTAFWGESVARKIPMGGKNARMYAHVSTMQTSACRACIIYHTYKTSIARVKLSIKRIRRAKKAPVWGAYRGIYGVVGVLQTAHAVEGPKGRIRGNHGAQAGGQGQATQHGGVVVVRGHGVYLLLWVNLG